jgi:hypothetical protein
MTHIMFSNVNDTKKLFCYACRENFRHADPDLKGAFHLFRCTSFQALLQAPLFACFPTAQDPSSCLLLPISSLQGVWISRNFAKQRADFLMIPYRPH